MGNKTIFINKECEEILKKLRGDNYKFNFSSFVQEALLEDKVEVIKIERIEEKIKDQKIKLNDSQENLAYWEGIKKSQLTKANKIMKEEAKIQANYDQYNNPKYIAKRLKEMKAAKRKNGTR